MIVNTAQGEGGGAKLNLYCQPSLPIDRFDGICILTPEQHTVANVVSRDATFAIGGTWDNINFGNLPGRAEGPHTIIPYGSKALILYQNCDASWAFYMWLFDAATNTFVHITDLGNDYMANQIQVKIDYNTHICYMRIRNGSYLEYYQTAFSFNFDTNVLTNLGSISVGTTDPWNVGNSYYFSTTPPDADGNCYWFANEWSSTECYFILYRACYGTNTFEFIANHSIPGATGTSDKCPVALYDKTVYCKINFTENPSSSLPQYYAVDTVNRTVTALTYPGLTSDNRSMAAVSMGKVFFQNMSNGFSLLVYDIGSNTWSTTPNAAEYLPDRLLVGLTDRVVAIHDYNGTTNTYHLTSEALTANTLAITWGKSFLTNIIKTAKINAIRTYFANVWWYSTQFNEYPTYIGNGSSWIKIKN